MNNFNCLDSIIAAAKVYLMFSGVLPQVPGGLHFFLEVNWNLSEIKTICFILDFLLVFKKVLSLLPQHIPVR